MLDETEPDSNDIIEQLPSDLVFEVPTGALPKRLPIADLPVEFADLEYEVLFGIYDQRRFEAKMAFWVAIPMAIVGTLIIFGGVVLALFGGVKGASFGAILDVLAFLGIKLYREVNAVRDMNTRRDLQKLIWAADQIVDPEKRDATISEVIKTFAKREGSTPSASRKSTTSKKTP